MSLARWIASNAERRPDRLALRHAGGELSYAALARCVDDVASALVASGLRAGSLGLARAQ